MSSNIYVISGKANNFKAEYNGKKIEIAKSPFFSKVIRNEEIPLSKIKTANNNKAEYFVELLDLTNSPEQEFVFKRKTYFSKEGFDCNNEAIGFYANGEVVPSIEIKYKKGSVVSDGKHVPINRSIKYFNGYEELYFDDNLIRTYGVKP